MGKKKSVVWMVLLTIVIVILCAITVVPTFPIPGTVQKWNPVVLQYDLGTDLGGGYYAYYYPEGVISETEYNSNLAVLEGEEKTDYESKYAQVKGSTLYFSTDEKLNILSGTTLTEEFKNAFQKASKEITARYQAKGYSSYRVAVVEGYALRVELPASESAEKASSAFSLFLNTGDMTLEKGGKLVDELKSKDAKITDLIQNVSIATRYKTSFLNIQFTKSGMEMLEKVKGELSESSQSSSNNTSDTTLAIKVGTETIVEIYKDNVTDDNQVRVLFVDQENKDYLRTMEILLDSALANGGYDITFKADAIRSFEPVFGENALTLLYIALAIVLVAILVVPVVKMGRFGVVSGYASLSYLIVTAICFAFITGGTFEINLGSVLAFLFGLVLVNALQYVVYQAIKAEFALGKTVESSVKGGYKKTLGGVIDTYAVLFLGALALLIAVAGVRTLALQMLICVITGAFINLLWARAINYIYLSASKDKYKYFRFVREDDDE